MAECSFCSINTSSTSRLVRSSASLFICIACARSGLRQILTRQISEDLEDELETCSLCNFTFPKIKCVKRGVYCICLFDIAECCKILESKNEPSNARSVHIANGFSLRAGQPIICKIIRTSELLDDAVLLNYPEIPISLPHGLGNDFQIGQEIPAFFVAIAQGKLLAFPDLPQVINGPWRESESST